jgi:hypothetical protein
MGTVVLEVPAAREQDSRFPPAHLKGEIMNVPHSTVVGVFPTRAQAEVAVSSLWHEGFPHNDVGLASPGEPARTAHTPEGEREGVAAAGAVTGAAAGGAFGAVAGALATALVPGVGPVLAGGLLVGALTGGAAGAALGTFAGPFIAMGFTEDEARNYEHQVKRGHTLVVVQAGERHDEVVQILHEAGAEEVNE